jgi:hypothetical protein
MKKAFAREVLIWIVSLLWIPAGIAAFFVSAVPLDAKLIVVAVASLIVLIVIWMKESQ